MINFRAVENADFEKIATLVTSPDDLYLISPKSTFPWTAEQVKAIANIRQFNTVAVNENEQIIGYANMYKVIENDTAFIGNVIVAKNCRKQGVGQALMRYMITICQDKLHAMPCVSVFNHNTSALKFYHRLGFVPVSMEEREMQGKHVMLIHFKRPSLKE